MWLHQRGSSGAEEFLNCQIAGSRMEINDGVHRWKFGAWAMYSDLPVFRTNLSGFKTDFGIICRHGRKIISVCDMAARDRVSSYRYRAV
jgi:hypothetical protein